MSPATTARAAAAPVSKGRTSTLAPYFLKKPPPSATSTTTAAKMVGMPGVAKTSFFSSARPAAVPSRISAIT